MHVKILSILRAGGLRQRKDEQQDRLCDYCGNVLHVGLFAAASQGLFKKVCKLAKGDQGHSVIEIHMPGVRHNIQLLGLGG